MGRQTPRAKHKDHPKKFTKKQVARKIAQQESRMRKTTKKANLQGELALVRITPEYKFFGEVIVELREDAISTAVTLSNLVQNQLALFTDGSAFSLVESKSGTFNSRGFGAAVVYKQYEMGDIWNESLYHLRGGPSSYRAELSAVAEASAIALPWAIYKYRLEKECQQLQMREYKVIIFTDCQDVLTEINKLRYEALPERRMLQGDCNLRKLITRSQYLRRLSVQLELRWVPAHARVEGNERADNAARRAANDKDYSIIRDKGLDLVAAELVKQ